jgi:hypothetical protein
VDPETSNAFEMTTDNLKTLMHFSFVMQKETMSRILLRDVPSEEILKIVEKVWCFSKVY